MTSISDVPEYCLSLYLRAGTLLAGPSSRSIPSSSQSWTWPAGRASRCPNDHCGGRGAGRSAAARLDRAAAQLLPRLPAGSFFQSASCRKCNWQGQGKGAIVSCSYIGVVIGPVLNSAQHCSVKLSMESLALRSGLHTQLQPSLVCKKSLADARPFRSKKVPRRRLHCRGAAQTALAPHQVRVQTYSGSALDLNFFPSHLPALFETYSERLEIRAYTWTDDDLVLFHQCNPRLRIERLTNGRVSVKPADGATVQALRKEILRQLRSWNEEETPDRGRCFAPPGGFFLPVAKSQRSPQIAFTGRDRWHLQMVGKPIGGLLVRACPQLCVELATSKETLEEARAKAKEYLIAG